MNAWIGYVWSGMEYQQLGNGAHQQLRASAHLHRLGLRFNIVRMYREISLCACAFS